MTEKRSTQSPTANGTGQFPAPPFEQAQSHEVRNPDASDDPTEGDTGDGLNQEAGDETRD